MLIVDLRDRAEFLLSASDQFVFFQWNVARLAGRC